MSKLKIILSILSIALAVFISFFGGPVLSETENTFVKVLVATDDINGKDKIDGSNTMLATYDISVVPEKVLDKIPDEPIYAENKIYKGDIITEHKVVDLTILNNELENQDSVIVSLQFRGLAESVSGLIKSGDKVSAVSYVSGKVVLHESLSELLVVDLVDRQGKSLGDSKNITGIGSSSAVPETIVLNCDMNQALKLIEIDRVGQLHFVLVNWR
jgi:hypothetical protein